MLNRVCLLGRLVADPELRSTGSDIPVTSFTIAVNRSYVKSGEERKADFIDIVAWRNTAEFICKYFRKGQLMAIEGSLQTRNYTDRDGNKRKAVEVLADNAYFAEPRRDNYSQGDSFQAPAPSFSSGDSSDFEEIAGDDDLPF